MTATTDALKRLRTICSTRGLHVEVTRTTAVVMVAVSKHDWAFSAAGTTRQAEAVFLKAHAAVLAKFPALKATGGARSTRETRAAGRARLAAEQRAAMGVES